MFIFDIEWSFFYLKKQDSDSSSFFRSCTPGSWFSDLFLVPLYEELGKLRLRGTVAGVEVEVRAPGERQHLIAGLARPGGDARGAPVPHQAGIEASRQSKEQF